jgi:hypothetical protein
MVECRSSSENTRLMNLISVLNKTSPWAHMKLELDMLGVPGKLVKYVVHLSKKSPRAHIESELDVLGVHGKLVKYVIHSSKRKN